MTITNTKEKKRKTYKTAVGFSIERIITNVQFTPQTFLI